MFQLVRSRSRNWNISNRISSRYERRGDRRRVSEVIECEIYGDRRLVVVNQMDQFSSDSGKKNARHRRFVHFLAYVETENDDIEWSLGCCGCAVGNPDIRQQNQSRRRTLSELINDPNMNPPSGNLLLIKERLAKQANTGKTRFTVHANQEMVEENVLYADIVDVLISGEIIENYPEHQRGACCLVCGVTRTKRTLHVCCTTSLDVAIIITVYEPKEPKWLTPYQRNR
jgi:hypothetical protein